MKQAKLLLSSFFLLTTFCASAQNVGIGTSAPLKVLHVQQGGTSLLNSAFGNGMIFSTNSASGARIFMENLAGPDGQKTMVLINENVSGQGTTYFGSLADDGSTFISPSILSMNHTSGNVGIGTKTPDAKLQIAGGVKIADSLNIGGQVRITSGIPGAGKVLTSDETGLASWTTPAAAGSLSIGDSYGGGIVFYVYDNGQHGLIAATTDQSTGIQWYNDVARPCGASGNGLNGGSMNTTLIIATQIGDNPIGNFASKICADYSAIMGGISYGDWYLPTSTELHLLYLQRNVVGGFSDVRYWGSLEAGADNARYHYFDTGGVQGAALKSAIYNVRAVRAF